MSSCALRRQFGDRASRVAHGEAEVPHHVEQMLDDLLASAGQLVGAQEENIDIGVRPPDRPGHNRRPPPGRGGSPWSDWLGIDDVRPPLEQRAQQLVDQGGLGRNDLGTGGPGFEAPAELPTALVAGASPQAPGRSSGHLDRAGRPLARKPAGRKAPPAARRTHSSLHTRAATHRGPYPAGTRSPRRAGSHGPGPCPEYRPPASAQRPERYTRTCRSGSCPL